MYSYADRMRAVQRYIKLGKGVGATIREQGYPTKNALKDWYREYERHHDLPAAYVRTKPWYSDEQKRVAVEHYLSRGHCPAEIRGPHRHPDLRAHSAQRLSGFAVAVRQPRARHCTRTTTILNVYLQVLRLGAPDAAVS